MRYDRFVHRFGQHFVIVANVLQRTGAGGIGLWNEEHQFYFDVIRYETQRLPLEIYSMVGLVPLFAATVVEEAAIAEVPIVMQTGWDALERRPHLRAIVPSFVQTGRNGTRLLSAVTGERLRAILGRVLDDTQFLSEYGIRSLSRRHLDQPFQFVVGGQSHEVRYLPGESDNRVFGGNSNWRGPIWFPMNFLLIQAIACYARYYEDSYTIECPTGSGRHLTLSEIADDLAGRLTRIFLPDANGRRAVFGANEHFQQDVHWRDYIPFHEFFHGDTGAGLGASHQTGWTALVALLLQYRGAVCFDRMWADHITASAPKSERAMAEDAAASA